MDNFSEEMNPSAKEAEPKGSVSAIELGECEIISVNLQRPALPW